MSTHRKQRHHKNYPITSTLICAVLTVLFFSVTTETSAQLMESGEYKLELHEVLDSESTPTPVKKAIIPTITPSPTLPPLQSYGQTEIFVSDDFIQFGPQSPTNPVLRQLRFFIDSPTLPFSLLQQMDHDLLNDPGQSIPATTCDNGSCSTKQASLWESTLTYGLGIRCENIEGTACPDDFIEKNTFRSLGFSEAAGASVIAKGASHEKSEFSLTYKLVVPGTQAPGIYQATASYILIPGI